MLKYFLIICLINLCFGNDKSFYSFNVEDIEGNEISLEKYKGKVSINFNFLFIKRLIVLFFYIFMNISGNFSSQCSYPLWIYRRNI